MTTTKQACHICDEEFEIQDLSTCQICGREVCNECQTIQGFDDELWIECKWCQEAKHDRRVR